MSEHLIRSDELVDRVFSRPIASAIVAVVRTTPVTPNMLTFVATCCGIAAGVCLALQQGVLAAVMIAGHMAFDCSDGQLARTRGGGGLMGRIADGFGDYLTGVAIHVGLLVWIASLHGWLVAVPAVAGAGFSLSWTSLLLDRYKQRYNGQVDNFDAIEAAYASGSWFERIMIRTFRTYSRRADDGVSVPDLEAYQRRVRRPMRIWLWVGPATHFATLAVCAILGSPLWYAFIACLPINVIALIALVIQHRVERRAPAVVIDRLDD